MKRFFRALLAVYNFFAGDAILLSGVIVAFGITFLLARIATNLIAILTFICVIVAALIVTLSREARSKSK